MTVGDLGRAIWGCPFHALTGLDCPMCGISRATVRVLSGDLVGAFAANPLWPLFAVVVVGLAVDARPVVAGLERRAAVVAALLGAFALIRNLPVRT